MKLKGLHHIAIICSDYEKSKRFYTEILGFSIEQEVYRAERQSYKLDLSLNGHYLIELFSFPNPPQRPTRPESAGLRHIAFSVENIEAAIAHLKQHNIDAPDIVKECKKINKDIEAERLKIRNCKEKFDRVRIICKYGENYRKLIDRIKQFSLSRI